MQVYFGYFASERCDYLGAVRWRINRVRFNHHRLCHRCRCYILRIPEKTNGFADES